MRAHLGDQLVIETPATGAARREGEIVGLHHEDGTPPYDVRWSDTDEVTLVFPGPDAHVLHFEHGGPGSADEARQEKEEPSALSGAAPPAVGADPGDIGRRVGAERRRQGLTLEEAAGRARMSPAYLAYLEERPADPSLATLIRLAGTLGTTVAELLGAGMDQPPGQGHASLHPRLRNLGPDECRSLLSTHGVGRIAVSGRDGHPAVVPVNYDVIDDAIVFRTAPGSVPAAAAGTEVAFEVDRLDEAMSRGWSVLAVGPASMVTDTDTMRKLARHTHTRPWAGGERDMWMSIRPTSLTGRRITPSDQ
ncbi:pyridoxamine 5'-phosphate oxidase family protein [Streptomyces sp. NPDC007903]|uniref:pyridoxamine 5'-phosphate oxidase family protein n=1 Tax=Streptomyces sp. NPDC007903 TaxID=3364786 RepID=UPI0036E9F6BD